MELYDVLAVNLETRRVRVLDVLLSAPNARAVADMAVLRRGLETEFFPVRPAGQYRDGDTFRPRDGAGPAA